LAYFDFNYVTDPPNDETVDVETQLNNNWEEVDKKTTPFNQMPADFSGIGIPIPIGTEAFDPEHPGSEHRIAAWNGTTWIRSLNHAAPWSGWQTMEIRSPVVIRTGFPVRARVDAIARRVVLSGGLYFNASQDPWPTGTTVEVTTDTAMGISLAPVNGGICCRQAAAGAITTTNGFASAVAIIETKTSPDRTALSIRYQGDAGGGNFVMLDGVSWWF